MPNLNTELANWSERLVELLSLPSNSDWASSLVSRGSMLRPPANENEIVKTFGRLGLPIDCPLADFYRFTNGLDLPCMDAEDGEIVAIDQLDWLKNRRRRVTFPASAHVEPVAFTESDAEIGLLLTPMIDSSFFVTIPARRYESWALFHHGDDKRYNSFNELLVGETRRIESSIRGN